MPPSTSFSPARKMLCDVITSSTMLTARYMIESSASHRFMSASLCSSWRRASTSTFVSERSGRQCSHREWSKAIGSCAHCMPSGGTSTAGGTCDAMDGTSRDSSNWPDPKAGSARGGDEE